MAIALSLIGRIHLNENKPISIIEDETQVNENVVEFE